MEPSKNEHVTACGLEQLARSEHRDGYQQQGHGPHHKSADEWFVGGFAHERFPLEASAQAPGLAPVQEADDVGMAFVAAELVRIARGDQW